MIQGFIELGSYTKVIKMLLISSFFFFGRLIPQLDKTMPSRSVLANWVPRFGQVCKEREAKVGVCGSAAALRGFGDR